MQIINDNFHPNAGKSLDDRLGRVVAGKTRLFASIEEANATNLSSFRYIGLTVLIEEEKGVQEYWYKDGTDDSNLIQKGVTNTTFPYHTEGYDINLDGTVSMFTFAPSIDFTPVNVIINTDNIDATGFNYSLKDGIVTVQYSAGPDTGITHFDFTFFKPNP